MEREHRVTLDTAAVRRGRAFLHQAREYYLGLGDLDPASKPLLAYYFALNLTKAYLTAVDPRTTVPTTLLHGIKQYYLPGQRYSYQREKVRVATTGVFPLLAARSGMRHCWANNYELRIVDLSSYLPDGFALYSDAYGKAPNLLEVEEVKVLFGAGKQAWLRVEIDRDALRQRNLSPKRVLTRSRVFGDRFRLVHTDEPTASYEAKTTFTYGQKRSEVLGDLRNHFDESLFATDRSYPGGRRFVVISERPALLSHEAVAFAVLHHLSSIVRYRPQDAERLLAGPHAWLFASWVERACESYLLNMASRITLEEHVLA